MEKIINYKQCNKFEDLLKLEKQRQNKEKLDNVKISFICKCCKKECIMWLNDPLTKDFVCCFNCLIGLKKEDFYSESSSLIRKECLLCANLYNHDKYGEFCSLECKKSYEKIMNS
jgi:hypothetical protein